MFSTVSYALSKQENYLKAAIIGVLTLSTQDFTMMRHACFSLQVALACLAVASAQFQLRPVSGRPQSTFSFSNAPAERALFADEAHRAPLRGDQPAQHDHSTFHDQSFPVFNPAKQARTLTPTAPRAAIPPPPPAPAAPAPIPVARNLKPVAPPPAPAPFAFAPQPKALPVAPVKSVHPDSEDALFKKQAESAHYAFDSSVDDGIGGSTHLRQEVRDGLKLAGSYSYSDGFFKRTVHYEADENGYRVVKDEAEPIGNGPAVDIRGTAQVSTNVDGIKNEYVVSAADIPVLRDSKSL